MAKREEDTARGVLELNLSRQGLAFAGVDEVGRGCLAGPVYAACVVLDFTRFLKLTEKEKDLFRDSKRLSAQQRAKVIPQIEELALASSVAFASVEEIDRLNILQATFLAMRRAIVSAKIDPQCLVLVDGNRCIPGYKGLQQALVKGDSLSYSIAAASILAKETRDAFMKSQAEQFKAYGFDANVGYGTPKHLAALKSHGASPLHRRSFAPVQAVCP